MHQIQDGGQNGIHNGRQSDQIQEMLYVCLKI